MTEYNIRLNPNCAAAVHTGLKFKAGDKGITFRIAVDELDTTGTTAKIVFLRANGTSVESDISGTDGVYIYKTLGNEFAVPGKTVADVKFYESGNRESTASFIFEVCGDTMNGLGAGTGGYSDRLEQLVSEAEAAGELTEQAKAELEAAESNMKSTEAEMAAVIQNFKNQYGEVGALNPRGNWNSGATYQIRDLVYYNSISWICLAPNTGVAPTDANTAYWMRSTDLESILNGTTAVGNAKLLNGLTAEEFVSNDNLVINPDFEVNTSGKSSYTALGNVVDAWKIPASSGFTLSVVDAGVEISNTGTSITYLVQDIVNSKDLLGKTLSMSASIDGAEGHSTFTLPSEFAVTSRGNFIVNGCTVYAYITTSSVQVTIAVPVGKTVTINWAKLELGSVATPFIPPNKEVEKLKCGVANADTLDGYHYKEWFAHYVVETKAYAKITDLPNGKWMYSGGNTMFTDYPTELSSGGYNYGIIIVDAIANNPTTGAYKTGTIIATNEASTSCKVVNFFYNNGTLSISDDASKYLPLDGSVPMSGSTMKLNNGWAMLEQAGGHFNIIMKQSEADGTTISSKDMRWLSIYSAKEIADVKNALKLTDYVNGSGKGYIVHHDGNSQKVTSSTSAPSDTSALWVDTTNKKVKAYIDGAWTAMA